MFVVRALASIALVFLPLSATAQITLSPDDLRPSLGMTWEQEIATVLSSLEETGFDIGSAGADQSFDFTSSFSNTALPPSRIRGSVISLEQTPGAANFPEADYAVHSIITVPHATGGMDEFEVYVYFQRSAAGDVTVGIEGGEQASLLFAEETPWPLEFGKSWMVENFSLVDQILPALGIVDPELLPPEVTISGRLDLQYVVDAWGEIRLPAGTFDCLRVHQTGTIVLAFKGNDQLAALGESTSEIDAYSWYAREFGAVAMAIEIRQTFAGGNIPPTTISQLVRLTAISIPATAITAESWGALKQKFAE